MKVELKVKQLIILNYCNLQSVRYDEIRFFFRADCTSCMLMYESLLNRRLGERKPCKKWPLQKRGAKNEPLTVYTTMYKRL